MYLTYHLSKLHICVPFRLSLGKSHLKVSSYSCSRGPIHMMLKLGRPRKARINLLFPAKQGIFQWVTLLKVNDLLVTFSCAKWNATILLISRKFLFMKENSVPKLKEKQNFLDFQALLKNSSIIEEIWFFMIVSFVSVYYHTMHVKVKCKSVYELRLKGGGISQFFGSCCSWPPGGIVISDLFDFCSCEHKYSSYCF